MQEKVCTKCKQTLPLARFSCDKTKKDGLYSACKECVTKYKKLYWEKYHDRLIANRRVERKEEYKRNKEQYKEYRCSEKVRHARRIQRLAKKIKAIELIHPEHKCQCLRCSETNIYCLDFHHLDPKEKETTWSYVGQKPWIDIKMEIFKCIPLCRNCHQKEHHDILFYEKYKEQIKEIKESLDTETNGSVSKLSFDSVQDTSANASTSASSFCLAPAPNIDDSNRQVASSLESPTQRVDFS